MTNGAARLDVKSLDGTRIAVWAEGDGLPLVLVHGSIADHTTFDAFIAVLRESWSVYAMDRRGFGASDDGLGYSVERDFEDVATVVNAVSSRTGKPVALWGHSYGANCAMGGATLTDRVSHLILYEPSLGIRYPTGSIDAIEAALTRGDREAAIKIALVDILELTDEEFAAMRATPLWPTRIAAAHTIPRECRVEDGWVYSRGQFDAVRAHTLFLAGSDSVPAVKQATARAMVAITDSRLRVLEGHAHFAHKSDPAAVDAIVGEFVLTGAAWFLAGVLVVGVLV
jgi:pimeloyl-ACP methyl ester carboxylesterase